MRASFVGQPFEEDRNLHDFLTEALGRADLNELTLVTAWAKRSGLRRVESELTLFQERGGTSRIILGIDEGGATQQGLRLAMDLFDEPYVFHDPTRRTFHPKLYIVKGPSHAEVFNGSNNMTAGGLYYNYESANHLELDLTSIDDSNYLYQVEAYVDDILSEEELCLPLTPELLRHLLECRHRYRIADEDELTQSRGSGTTEAEDTDQTHSEGDPSASPFGRPAGPRRPDPRPHHATPRRVRASEATATFRTSSSRGSSTPTPDDDTVEQRWFKRLPLADAQQNRGNKTANLRLTQADLDIDWLTFFREDFFGAEDWRRELDPQGHPKEVADVDFDVFFHNQHVGPYTLQVAHAPHRESDQRNHATVLHWGDLNPHLRERSYHGSWVIIDRLASGHYRLELRENKPDTPP